MLSGRCLVVGCVIGLSLLGSSRAIAVTLYSNTTPASSGVADGGPATEARLDDVHVNNILNPSHLALAVTQVTFGIIRDPGAPAVNVTGWWGTISTPADPDEFPLLNSPITSFGTASLGAFGGGSPTIVPVVIGNGTTTLFTVNPNFTDSPGFGEFAVGLQFSTGDARNNWALAQYTQGVSPLNFDGAWLYTFASNSSEAFALGTAQEPFYTTFHLNVQGDVVPEPASGVTLLAASLILLARRRLAM